jgi:hypothetical protein
MHHHHPRFFWKRAGRRKRGRPRRKTRGSEFEFAARRNSSHWAFGERTNRESVRRLDRPTELHGLAMAERKRCFSSFSTLLAQDWNRTLGCCCSIAFV